MRTSFDNATSRFISFTKFAQPSCVIREAEKFLTIITTRWKVCISYSISKMHNLRKVSLKLVEVNQQLLVCCTTSYDL